MSFPCVSGGKECTGCMSCQEVDDNLEQCQLCGEYINTEEDSYVEHEKYDTICAICSYGLKQCDNCDEDISESDTYDYENRELCLECRECFDV